MGAARAEVIEAILRLLSIDFNGITKAANLLFKHLVYSQDELRWLGGLILQADRPC